MNNNSKYWIKEREKSFVFWVFFISSSLFICCSMMKFFHFFFSLNVWPLHLNAFKLIESRIIVNRHKISQNKIKYARYKVLLWKKMNIEQFYGAQRTVPTFKKIDVISSKQLQFIFSSHIWMPLTPRLVFRVWSSDEFGFLIKWRTLFIHLFTNKLFFNPQIFRSNALITISIVFDERY